MHRSWTVLVALGLATFAPSAFGYLDPGTGSMIIQGLVAAIAMAGLTLKLYWYKLLSLFGIKTNEADDDGTQASEIE